MSGLLSRSVLARAGCVLVLALAAAAGVVSMRHDQLLYAAATVLAGAVAAFALLRRASWRVLSAMAVLSLVGTTVAAGALHRALRGEDGDLGLLSGPTLPPSRTRAVREEAKDKVTFAVWSDSRGGASIFQRVLDDIARRRPDFMVGVGDLVGMARTYQFEILERKLRATGVPFAVVPGNHDLAPDGSLAPFERVFGRASWDVALGGVLLLGIDTSEGVRVGEVGRVRALFAAHTGADLALFSHYPLFPLLGRAGKTVAAGRYADGLREAVRDHRANVFSGNFHGYEVQDLGGHHQVVTGGAGSKLEADVPYHYVLVESRAGSLRFERIDVARREDASPWADRWIALRDETPFAARADPLVTGIGLAALGLAFGAVAALVAVPRRRRRRQGGEGGFGEVTTTSA